MLYKNNNYFMLCFSLQDVVSKLHLINHQKFFFHFSFFSYKFFKILFEVTTNSNCTSLFFYCFKQNPTFFQLIVCEHLLLVKQNCTFGSQQSACNLLLQTPRNDILSSNQCVLLIISLYGSVIFCLRILEFLFQI